MNRPQEAKRAFLAGCCLWRWGYCGAVWIRQSSETWMRAAAIARPSLKASQRTSPGKECHDLPPG